jgi:hypothetical protein
MLNRKFFLIVFFFAVVSPQNIFAQTYYVPMTGTLGPFYTCTGIFYDSQLDPAVNYTNNQNGMVTICSAVNGQYVSMTFTSMALMDNTDILRIYSGTGTGGPLLQTWAGPVNTGSFSLMIVSQDATAGCLTAQFQTGSSGVAAGWNASIGCQLTTSINETESPLSLNLPSPQTFSLQIFSVDGKMISEKNYSLGSGQQQIAVSTKELQQGVYFCRVAGKEINKTFKFMK